MLRMRNAHDPITDKRISERRALPHRAVVNAARALLWVPLPPPYAGPEVASEQLVRAVMQHMPDTLVENASLRTSNAAKGSIDVAGVEAFARAYRRYLRALSRVNVVCLVAAASTAGCIRDAALVAAARALGKQVILHFRGGRYDDYYSSSSRPMQALLRLTWGSARTAIVETPRLGRMLRDAAPHVPIAVMPNGLNEDSNAPKQDYARSGRILFVGHLTYPKGFNDLAHVFRELHAQDSELVLSCAGELPQPDRRLADFLPVARQAEFIRRRQELCDETRAFVHTPGVEYAGVVTGQRKRELFERADVFVLPSYTEGFPIAILEAMFHGLPVVSTSVGGVPDVIRDGENGFIVAPGDHAALAAALRRLVDDRELRERIGRRNAAEARERYGLDVVARRFSEILKSVLP